MAEDRPRKNISLDLIAICVFGLTCSSLLAPLLQVSSTVPLLVIGGIVAIATFDNFVLKSLLSTLVIDTLSSNDSTYRQRIINHEAGHFLVAYLSGIEIESYSLTAWEALKQGQSAQGGTVFAPLTDSNIPAELLQKYCRVWMAGIAAERLVYERAEGGFDDRQKLRSVMALIGKDAQSGRQQENLAIVQAKALIQTNWDAYQALTAAMTARTPVAECCQILRSAIVPAIE
jgi:hypothetical protein